MLSTADVPAGCRTILVKTCVNDSSPPFETFRMRQSE